MISREEIEITDVSDYQKLLDAIDDRDLYVDKNLISQLSTHIGLECQRVIVEYPYYENDFLSSYYIFYAKKLQNFPKECYRIIFYADEDYQNLMGYITLRPVYEGRRLGKIFFDPRYLTKEKMHLILSDCKCHLGGSESFISLFPHMRQEGDVAVCAHVAIWSVLRSFTLRFRRYPELTLGKIVEMVSSQAERPIPSHGLTVYQISKVFMDTGFSPVVLFPSDKNSRLIREALISYIDSGIPVVAFLSKWNHAVSVIGLGDYLPQHDRSSVLNQAKSICPFETYWENGREVSTPVILSSRFYNSIVVNDDNYFPYAMVRMKRPAPAQTGSEEAVPPYSIADIDRLIVPLYPRIQLAYEDVRTIFLRMMAANSKPGDSPMIGRIFLTSANTYREYVNEACQNLDPVIKTFLIDIKMPKFIWCVEISTPEHYQQKNPVVDGLLIFDSTSATINPEPLLFAVYPDRRMYFRKDGHIMKGPDAYLAIPRFNRNLKEVN